MCRAMPTLLHRLIALTAATALLLLVALHLTYGRLPTFDGRLALLDGIALSVPARTLTKALIVASTKAENTSWIQEQLPE
jgi:hypothetical protein